jgi:hypothetical protein
LDPDTTNPSHHQQTHTKRDQTPSQAHAADVGVSYGLVAAAGLLTARVPRRWARLYVAGMSVLFAVGLLVNRTFTDLGHAAAWVIGLGLALVAWRAQVRAEMWSERR